MPKHTIGFGGSCHWCTEAIFQSLIGVAKVDQGWIASKAPDDSYSEAVLVRYDPKIILLETLIEIHLLTHSCTSDHLMRRKYRSAIYTLNPAQSKTAMATIERIQNDYADPIITKVLLFKAFERNIEEYLDYYQKNPEKPFCRNYITPKLNQVMQRYSRHVK